MSMVDWLDDLNRAATLTYFILVAIVNSTNTLSLASNTHLLCLSSAAPVGNCSEIYAAAMWSYAIAIPSTTLLFFFRVRAVYLDNKYVIGTFAVMWLGVLATSITATQQGGATRIGPTNYCIFVIDVRSPFILASVVIPFINDTLGFCAVTWRLTMNSQINPTFKSSFKSMAFGHYLPIFSRALLQDGQIYFLWVPQNHTNTYESKFPKLLRSTVGIYVLTIITAYSKSIPPAYSTMFGVSIVAVMNALACRMYRNTKLGLYRLPALNMGSETAPSKPLAFHAPYTSTRNDSVISGGEDRHTLLSDGVSSHTKLQKVQKGESSPPEKLETMVWYHSG